jgi:predicted ATP-dependent serine protease
METTKKSGESSDSPAIMNKSDAKLQQIDFKVNGITKDLGNNQSQITALLNVKSANDWLHEAKDLTPDRMLYDEFWCEEETCFLFGGPGSGKSALSVQIAIEISKNEPVLFCDFELSLRQFAKRYRTSNGDFFDFPDNFFRAEFQRNIEFNPDSLVNSIHLNAIKINAKVIIIDNISWIIENSEKGDVAGVFMKKLTTMKNDNKYSMLIVAHTPKRDATQPITLKDMAGSVRLQNFIDSSFAIVESQKMQGYRYVKQTKTRSEETVYGFDNVKTGIINKAENGFMGIQFMGTSNEMEHLQRPNENERENIKQKCMDLIKMGKPFREIQELTGLSLGAISKYKKQMNGDEILPF